MAAARGDGPGWLLRNSEAGGRSVAAAEEWRSSGPAVLVVGAAPARSCS